MERESELQPRQALERAAPEYLEILDLAPDVLAAGDEEELLMLRSSSSQLGISLLVLVRHLDAEGQGSSEERALLRELSESLIVLTIVSSPEELGRARLLDAASLRQQAQALDLTLG